MTTNSLSRIASAFIDECSKIPYTGDPEAVDLTSVLSTLPHIMLDDGYVLDCVTPECIGLGGETLIFIRRKDAVLPSAGELRRIHFIGKDPDSLNSDGVTVFYPERSGDGHIWQFEHFTVSDSPEGYWECFLLSEMWRFLPLFWHAGYARRTFILDSDELLNIAMLSESDVELCRSGNPLPEDFWEKSGFRNCSDILKIGSLSGDPGLLPGATENSCGFDFVYHYWTGWDGLFREEVSVSRTGQGRIRIGQIQSENLASYFCGVVF